eukprot:759214-Hanusia_phi.AAC.8
MACRLCWRRWLRARLGSLLLSRPTPRACLFQGSELCTRIWQARLQSEQLAGSVPATEATPRVSTKEPRP